jgi:predicted pyridoxine 5'-phosphate oxidase superfamily flavin-nucleotide-binding protein
MLTQKVKSILDTRAFVSVATCNFKGQPNVAPKFVLKHEGNFIYLADHVIGTSYRNLKINPLVAIGIMNLDDLHGYRVNGSVEIIESGPEHAKLLKEFVEKVRDQNTRNA